MRRNIAERWFLGNSLSLSVLLIVSIFFALPVDGKGAVINVPSDQPSLQAAVAAANDGDQIVLADDTYAGTANRDIDLRGRQISITSASGPANCIIDLENDGTAFLVDPLATVTISGLTIMNGSSGLIGEYDQGDWQDTAGKSTTVENCVFEDLTVGIDAREGLTISVSNSSFLGNQNGFSADRGTTANIDTCTIENTTYDAIQLGGTTITISNTQISENSRSLSASESRVEIYGSTISNSVNTGIEVSENSSVKLYGSMVSNSETGIYANYDGYLELNNCVVTGNAPGGGIRSESNTTIVGCLITNNTGGEGGGARVMAQCTTIVNSTIVDNIGTETASGLAVDGGDLTIANTIILGNTGSGLPQFNFLGDYEGGENSILTIRNSNIDQDGIAGTQGNIRQDPLFVDAPGGNYRLQLTSPCIDSGYHGIQLPDADLDDNLRALDGLNSGTPVVDMGAYEYSGISRLPVPVFSADLHQGIFPVKVWFSDHSLGNVESWLWDFGDGETSSQQNPSHTYKTADQFDITLTVSGPEGSNTITVVDDINILAPAIIRIPADQPTIQAGVNAAAAGDIVLLADGLYTGSGNTNIAVADGQWVRIFSENGPDNCIIDGGGSGTVFNLQATMPTTVELEGVTIKNSDTAIACNYDAHVTVKNCIIQENGIGLAAQGARCDIYSSQIRENQSGTGSIRAEDGARLVIKDTMVADNAGIGIGLSSYSSGTILNCTIAGNDGSGLSIWGSSASIANTILWGNSPGDGIQIYRYIDEEEPMGFTVQSSNIDQDGFAGIDGNIRTDPLFFNPTIGDYHLNTGSPCIDAGTEEIELGDTDFEQELRIVDGDNNASALVDMGADEHTWNLTPVSDFTGTPRSGPYPMAVIFQSLSSGIVNSWNWDFGDGQTSNDANPTHTYLDSGQYSVALTVSGPNGMGTLTKSGYINVDAPPTIYVPGDQPDLQSAINAAMDGYVIRLADGIYSGNFSLSNHSITIMSENGPENCILDGNATGPVLSFNEDEGTGKTCTLTGLRIRNGKGASMYNPGAGIRVNGLKLAINNCQIVDNDGAGVEFNGYTLEIRDSMIQNNLGDGIWTDLSGDVYAVNTQIIGNAGSGINVQGDITVWNCTFADNSGNGVYGMSFSSQVVTISDSIFRGNGGGLRCGLGNTTTIINCIIEEQAGRGVDVRTDASADIIDCQIRANGGPGIYAEGDNASATIRGSQISDNLNSGIFVGFQASINAYNTEITGNQASSPANEPFTWSNSGGGALVTEGGIYLENCLVKGNSGDRGGGIAAEWGRITAESCIFQNNTARQGGAIASGGGNLKINNTHLFENASEEYGGGIFAGVETYAELTNNMIFRNSAGRGGGLAIFTATGGSPYSFKMLNDTIVNNSATEYGGGIVGGNLLGADTPMVMTNTIVWGNTAPVGAQFHKEESASPVVVLNCDIDEAGYTGIDGNLRLEPLFVDPDNDDYHLSSGSPLIDQGTHTLLSSDYDIDGNTRIFDGNSDATEIVDMGADEYVGAIVNFSADATGGLAPLTVNFSDLSEGTIVSWLWDFGDSQTGAVQHPSHTYTNPGEYTVSLTIATADGKTLTTAKGSYISAGHPAPVAQYSATPLSGYYPLDVDFTDASTGATSWSWSFGDGANSTAQHPTHTYTIAGIFDVTLTVSGPGGGDDEIKSGLITVMMPVDTDGDGTYDHLDPDDDNDGVEDIDDAFPLDDTEWVDTDGDGIGNNADLDDDGDGLPDTWENDHGLDPLDDTGDNGSTGDPDGDGWNNGEELFYGTMPNNNLDVPPPMIKEVIPHDNAGVDPDTTRVAVNCAFSVLVHDSGGIDTTDTLSVVMTIDDGVNAAYPRNLSDATTGITSLTQDSADERTRFWVVYNRSADTFGDYAFGTTVNVTVAIKDSLGTADRIIDTFTFEVETQQQHDDAAATAPPVVAVQSTDPILNEPEYTDPTGIEITDVEDPLVGAAIVFDQSETVTPSLGPTTELPVFDAPSADAVGVPLNLQPPAVFVKPVKIRIPCPGFADVSILDVHYFNGTDWVLACTPTGIAPTGEDWVVDGSRVNRNDLTPPVIELKVYHFSGAQAALPKAAHWADDNVDWDVDGSDLAALLQQISDGSVGDVAGALSEFALRYGRLQ